MSSYPHGRGLEQGVGGCCCYAYPILIRLVIAVGITQRQGFSVSEQDKVDRSGDGLIRHYVIYCAARVLRPVMHEARDELLYIAASYAASCFCSVLYAVISCYCVMSFHV